jgi:hypothetical protein
MDNKTYVYKDSSGNNVASGSWVNQIELVPVIASYNGTFSSRITVDFGQNGYTPSNSSFKPLRAFRNTKQADVSYPVLDTSTGDGGTYTTDKLGFSGSDRWSIGKGSMKLPAAGKWAMQFNVNGAPYNLHVEGAVFNLFGLWKADQGGLNGTVAWSDGILLSDVGYHYKFQSYGSGEDTGSNLTANSSYELLIDMDNKTYVYKDSSGNNVASGSWVNQIELVPVIASYNGTFSSLITVDFGQNGYTPSNSSYRLLESSVTATPLYNHIVSPKYYHSPTELTE